MGYLHLQVTLVHTNSHLSFLFSFYFAIQLCQMLLFNCNFRSDREMSAWQQSKQLLSTHICAVKYFKIISPSSRIESRSQRREEGKKKYIGAYNGSSALWSNSILVNGKRWREGGRATSSSSPPFPLNVAISPETECHLGAETNERTNERNEPNARRDKYRSWIPESFSSSSSGRPDQRNHWNGAVTQCVCWQARQQF